MAEIKLDEIAVAIGAPVKPRRIGGPILFNQKIGPRFGFDVQVFVTVHV